MNVLIIEDEMPVAIELAGMLRQIDPGIYIEEMIPSVSESVRWLKQHKPPDLIFCDVALSDGSSFEIFQECHIDRPVIFCTAHDEYALEAFRNNGIDYLLKPVNPQVLERSFKKIKDLHHLFLKKQEDNYYRRLKNLIHRAADTCYRHALLSHENGQIHPIPVDRIQYIEAKQQKTRVYTETESYEIRETLEQLLLELDPECFCQINQYCLVRRSAVKTVESMPGQKLALLLYAPGVEVLVVSRECSARFLDWIDMATDCVKLSL